jgi:hypothetical protein
VLYDRHQRVRLLHIFIQGEHGVYDREMNVNDKYIQGVSRLVDIAAGGDFLGICDQKSLYEHVSDFGRLRSYGHF